VEQVKHPEDPAGERQEVGRHQIVVEGIEGRPTDGRFAFSGPHRQARQVPLFLIADGFGKTLFLCFQIPDGFGFFRPCVFMYLTASFCNFSYHRFEG
jgi:hypothetical protein